MILRKPVVIFLEETGATLEPGQPEMAEKWLTRCLPETKVEECGMSREYKYMLYALYKKYNVYVFTCYMCVCVCAYLILGYLKKWLSNLCGECGCVFFNSPNHDIRGTKADFSF